VGTAKETFCVEYRC
jgi:hypothetical protein